MLTLNGVIISAQDFGTRIAIFLQGEKKDIEFRHYAFYNHEACKGELEWWSDNCALFWIASDHRGLAEAKLFQSLTNCALFEILNTENTKGTNPINRAKAVAKSQIEQMTWVNWYKERGSVWEIYAMGSSVRAEKETGNFDDDVVAKGLERNAGQKVEAELVEETT